MPGSAPGAATRAGISLIELLVAMAIAGVVISVTLTLAKRQDTGSGSSLEHMSALRTARHAVTSISRDIEALSTGRPGHRPFVIRADATVLAFSDEALRFFFEPDSSTVRDDDFVLYRQLEGAAPEVVARHLIRDMGEPFFSFERGAPAPGAGPSIEPLRGSVLPVRLARPQAARRYGPSSAADGDLHALRVTLVATNGLNGEDQRSVRVEHRIELPRGDDAPALGANGSARQAEPRMTGLAELPGLFGRRDPDGPPGALLPGGAATPVPLHAEPNAGAPRIAVLSTPDLLEWRERDYEAPAAVAYGASDGWVRVAILDGEPRRYGWVPPEHTPGIEPLGRLLEEGLSYLTDAWDGTLRDTPTAAAPPRRGRDVADRDPVDVRVVEVRESQGVLWLRVDVLGPGRCLGRTPGIEATGWVRALAADGRPNAWFHSRGC